MRTRVGQLRKSETLSLGFRYEEIEMVERVVDIEVTRYGTILEEIELICTMTGFRMRFLVEHTCDGSQRSVELEAG